MMDDITRLESPIDVQILLHKAFHALSLRVEQMAAESEKGGDLTEFQDGFGFWVKQLLYHATTEDNFMTNPLKDQPARDNEAEHVELVKNATGIVEFLGKGDAAGLEDSVKAAMFTLDEQQHEDLIDSAKNIQDILMKEMGQDRVVVRTRRHLYRKVMDMRILEFDHFENEEAFVNPLVREQMTDQQELALAKRLLIDE
ncbi:MAG: hypothetical protein O2821_13640, partial [Chloroflexi bacterium]|nr:hypothetical protein [Chloroflexota bacterium]